MMQAVETVQYNSWQNNRLDFQNINNNVQEIEEEEEDLPKDPRQWTREHVSKWLNQVTEEHGLPEIPPSRFLMNGKALCLMSLNMFLCRVPLGGKLLYKDFQLRLCNALYSTTINH